MTSEIHRGAGAAPKPFGADHVNRLAAAAAGLDMGRIEEWGQRLAGVLTSGGRILVAGNGGSAAEAQHLTAELVGRYQSERGALSALALNTDSSTVTAVGNDYGYDEVFARQVAAHGRAGDILLCLSTSGRSANLLRAVEAATAGGLTTWGLTGRIPNPLAQRCDDVVAVDSAVTSTIQECHLAVIHMLCAAVDDALLNRRGPQAGIACAPVDPASAPGMLPKPRVRIVIVGDTLLDRDLVGTVTRLSPEAPVPVVGAMMTRSRPGGAGLAALLAAREGHDVVLVTALAADEAGDDLRSLLAADGVTVVDLGLDGGTPVKVRIRAADRTLLMLDRSDGAPGEIGAPPESLAAILASASAVLVSDYGRGMAAVPAVRDTVAAVAATVSVVWDPHPRGTAPVRGVCLVTPNRSEVERFATSNGAACHAVGDELAADTVHARSLLATWGVPRIAVTRGAAGAVLVEDTDHAPLVVTTAPARSGDSVGAGDRFAVVVAGLLGRGQLPTEAVVAAVASASAYVSAGGASALFDTEAKTPVAHEDFDDPIALAERVRAAGGKIVATGGCFDILHIGHLAMLTEARALGDCLIVCLNGDASVARLKGPRRPIITAADRAGMLLGLQCVDAVLVFDEDTPARALDALRPHIYVKGGDYAIQQLPEAAVVESHGGQVLTLPYRSGHSTTSVIEQATGTVLNVEPGVSR